MSNVQYKSIMAMIFNEIKCYVNTSLGLVGGCIPCIPPLCPRLTAVPLRYHGFNPSNVVKVASIIASRSRRFCKLIPGNSVRCFPNKNIRRCDRHCQMVWLSVTSEFGRTCARGANRIHDSHLSFSTVHLIIGSTNFLPVKNFSAIVLRTRN